MVGGLLGVYYYGINSTKSPTSGAGEPRPMSKAGGVREVELCSQSGGGACISLLSRDRGGRTVTFVRLALNVVMQNGGDFMAIIVLYRTSH